MFQSLILPMKIGVSYGSGALKALQNDNIPELDLLVREAIQNSSDAAINQPEDSCNIFYTQCWSIKWTIRFLPSKMNHLLADICLKVFGASLTPFLLMVWMLPT